jgi:hypothetical protein
LIFLVHKLPQISLQQLEQFGSRHEQFAPQHTAGFYFLPLNQPIHGVIIDAEHIGGFFG